MPTEPLRRRLLAAGVPETEHDAASLAARFPIDLRGHSAAIDADVIAEVLLRLIESGIVGLKTADPAEFLASVPGLRHICHAYRSSAELIQLSVAFLRLSLARGEAFCWVVPPFLSRSSIVESIDRAGLDARRLQMSMRLELLDHADWYFSGGALRPLPELLEQWAERERIALEGGHSGLAVNGDGSSCVETMDDLLFLQSERAVHSMIENTRMRALCTYSVALCERSAEDLRAIAASHGDFVLRSQSSWLTVPSGRSSPPEQLVRALLAETR